MKPKTRQRGAQAQGAVLELRVKIFELHAQRKNAQEIAEALDIAKSTVYLHIRKAYQEAAQPIVEQELQRDLQLIEKTLHLACEKYANTLDPADYGPIDKMLDKRAKLLGMYAPERHQHTVTEVTAEDIELIELINEQRMKNNGVLSSLNEDAS